MTFIGRLILIVSAALLATLLLVAAGAFVASERVTANIERARVSHMLGSLRAATEANLSIGLALDQISSLQARIERENAADAAIIAIDIFNAQERSVSRKSIYSTDRGSIGENVPWAWTERLANNTIWSVPGHGETVYITRFDNDLGLAGGIAITVSDSARDVRNERLLQDLAWHTGLIALGTIAVGIVLSLIFSHMITRPFRTATALLKGSEIPVSGEGMEHLAQQTRRNWDRMDVRLDTGLKQLEALDDAQ
ncbi:hypothetical protein [Azorhizobium]|nr:hypothetical protein [Azorhizobium]TDT89397.1 hypothetical protein DFO45_4314 [Azorhizobium sp. AG788]